MATSAEIRQQLGAAVNGTVSSSAPP